MNNLLSSPVNPVAAEARAALSTRHNWKDAYAAKVLGRLLRGAADEIDRLTRGLAMWSQVWDQVKLDNPTLREDNKPLAVAATYALITLRNAELVKALEEAQYELQLRRPSLEYPGDNTAFLQSGFRHESCACAGRGQDDAHRDDCPHWRLILKVRAWWHEKHVIAWSCRTESQGGPQCSRWCGNQQSCIAATKDGIDIRTAAMKEDAK